MLDAKFIRQRKTDLKKAKLKLRILTKRSLLESELEKMTKKKGKSRQAIFPDIGNREDESAQEVEMYDSHLSIEKRLEEILKETNKALDRIKKGTYDKCEKCGQSISKARLKAYPEAGICLKCMKK